MFFDTPARCWCCCSINALDVLGMRISCDARWNNHIFRVAKEAFKCRSNRCKKYFTPSDLLTIYRIFIRPRKEYNSNVWAGASRTILKLLNRVRERAKVLINDNRISNSIDSLEHRRNVTCAKLSAFPKLMEKLVTDYLSFNMKSLISPFQHGVLKGRSTVTNLLECTIHAFRGFLARAQIFILISVKLLIG